jgi:hypothetical protein
MSLSRKDLDTPAEERYPRFPQSMRGKSERERRVASVLCGTFHVSTALIITTSFIVYLALKVLVVELMFVNKRSIFHSTRRVGRLYTF